MAAQESGGGVVQRLGGAARAERSDLGADRGNAHGVQIAGGGRQDAGAELDDDASRRMGSGGVRLEEGGGRHE